jgi:uncharacterized protein YfaS (alpha-2-macroglobulin family)
MQQDVIVRDPVVITASLPQFLAPGDRSQVLVELANTDGPEGEYELSCSPHRAGCPGAAAASRQTLSLPSGARSSLVMPLEGSCDRRRHADNRADGP